jgi:hypothetical protein
MKLNKVLNPRDPDTKYLGVEPQWNPQPADDKRSSIITKAFVWYNYFYNKKDAKAMVIAWLEAQDRKSDVNKLRSVPENTIPLTLGWLCRMQSVGLELNEKETTQFNFMLDHVLASKQKVESKLDVVDDAVARPNIQDRLREKMIECAGEIEGLFDEFCLADTKLSADFKPVTILRGKNVSPQWVHEIIEPWKQRREEFEDVLSGKDGQLVEGYKNFTKAQIKNIIKFCDLVIDDCNSYVQIKKVERKPRTVKPISPEKAAAKFRYLKQFEELKLVSEPAARLVNRSEAWLYDTKKRKLIHVTADSHVGTFTVKNNALIGFSATETQQKTLRKPEEQIKSLLAAGKPGARKFFKDIKSTPVPFNGRGSDNLIILKTW